MSGYSELLSVCALVGALCSGFILAQSPRRRATQIAALLVLATSWWALCESRVGAAGDAHEAWLWMRASTPGWAFISGFLPHFTARYFDAYPEREMARLRRIAMGAAGVGYAAGALVVLAVLVAPGSVHSEIHPVAWGWNHVPGPAELAYFAVSGPCAGVIFPMTYKGFRSSVAVAPLAQRVGVYVGIGIPSLTIVVTEVWLPMARIDFPRLGAASYSIFGLTVVIAVLRYGLSFFTPHRFSEEILDTLHEGVAMLTPAGRVRRANRSFVRLCGHPVEVLIGMPAATLFGHDFKPNDAILDAPMKLRTSEDETVPVSLSAVPLQDHQGNEMGLVIVVRDMREIEGLRRQMVTQARLAAVGELAAGLAHEINNPLAFVRANLGLLEGHVKALASADEAPAQGADRSELEGEAAELIEESLQGVARMSSIVQGVRRFTDTGPRRRELVDLNELLEDTLGIARLQSRAGELEIAFSPGELPATACAPQDMRQVLLNLLVNAAEAMGRQGRIRVTTRSEAGEIVVDVLDEGPGMSAEAVARVFDPFYTTKQTGEGTGLGLTIAWHIVDAHGGFIEVESAPGEGSRFSVHLPA